MTPQQLQNRIDLVAGKIFNAADLLLKIVNKRKRIVRQVNKWLKEYNKLAKQQDARRERRR